ncbi:signal transduction histidine kinase [Anaerobacterium chartisolvens]|uniref:histidine kinase n=1 Tax=Anaerobacterium chartisolvens TaxID=1297424 RepID=A0A369BD48_9FIRM|nr:ATP-binding protein [Anaerobacterium chartisolvens]RCX19490.1 signal transduction histidine kinase [Anaerobacterium chartisolvens]
MKSIAVKLWSGMMLLVIVVLILLWLFQIVFLESFYTNQRVDEVKNRGIAVLKELDDISRDELESRLDSFIYDYNCSINLVDTQGNNVYSNGAARQMPMMIQNYFRADHFNEVISGKIISVPLTHPRFNSTYMLIGIPVNTGEKITGALLINMPLAPVKDTAAILKKQLIYISTILFFVALLLSFILARTFIKPILSITRATGEMASGNLAVRLKIKSRDEIGRLSLAINHLGEELSKIEQLRRDFVANVSHELRTPLSLIRGYAETIRDVTGGNEEKRAKQLEIIIEESQRLGAIVDDILDLSQMQSATKALNLADFDLNNTIKDIAERYDLISSQTGIRLLVNSHGSVIVKGDEARVQQVLHNLLNNAFNHSQSGASIVINMERNDEKARIEVSDTGKGISQEDMKHIWERYYKADKSSKSKHLGTGLGLAIVKNILEAHQCKYGVESTVGKGTVFWFNLPVA